MLIALTLLVIAAAVYTYHRRSTSQQLIDNSNAPKESATVEDQEVGSNNEKKLRITTEEDKDAAKANPEPQALSKENDTISVGSFHKPAQQTPKIIPPEPFASGSKANPNRGSSGHVNGFSPVGSERRRAPPAFPSIHSAQRASAATSTRVPTKLTPEENDTSSVDSRLMPPPARFVVSRSPQTITSTVGSLRIPGGSGQQRQSTSSSLMPPSNKTTSGQRKVILEPGHSPLDWAMLQRSSDNLSGVSSLQRVTPSQLKLKNGRRGMAAWSSYQGKVYNLTPYIPFHPGGEGEIRRAAGKDGEKLFNEVHPWVNWENMLGECLVGILVSEQDKSKVEGGSLDDVD